MSYPLTHEETAAIEEYFAKGGKITKCRPCAMSEDDTWDTMLGIIDPREASPSYESSLAGSAARDMREEWTPAAMPSEMPVDEAMKLGGWPA